MHVPLQLSILIRSLSKHKPHSSTHISTVMNPLNSVVKPSMPARMKCLHKSTESLQVTVRRFSKLEITISWSNILGQGVFAKCYIGFVGPMKLCVKVLRVSNTDNFYKEVNILSSLCHPNVCYLFGICKQAKHHILLSFHGIDSQSCSLHSVLLSRKKVNLELASAQWKTVVLGIITGLKYIHEKSILHNDIKEDNILLDKCHDSTIRPVIVDFGKACLEGRGKRYNLTQEEIQLYKSKHPHIAPDLLTGVRTQDKMSDVFSFGRLISILCKEVISIPVLISLMSECTRFSATERPKTNELYTFLSNLLK